MTGTARRIFTMALQYAKERYQFDVPIGSFQAIQHKLAEMSLALERATAAVQYASMTVDAQAPDRTRVCHVAKAAAGEAARRIVKDGIQIHGGIGYTWEHDLHLFLRRATADEYLLGTTGWHHDQLATSLFGAGEG
jgi:alkylation response protein AidB-like acyl-CoA dehydrogenase